jgi:hypothetical protein
MGHVYYFIIKSFKPQLNAELYLILWFHYVACAIARPIDAAYVGTVRTINGNHSFRLGHFIGVAIYSFMHPLFRVNGFFEMIQHSKLYSCFSSCFSSLSLVRCLFIDKLCRIRAKTCVVLAMES